VAYRSDHHPRLGVEASNGGERLHAGEARHGEVEQHDVVGRRVAAKGLHGLLPVHADLDRAPHLLEQEPRRRGEALLVLGQQHAQAEAHLGQLPPVELGVEGASTSGR
jgi:hypothetical protein